MLIKKKRVAWAKSKALCKYNTYLLNLKYVQYFCNLKKFSLSIKTEHNFDSNLAYFKIDISVMLLI